MIRMPPLPVGQNDHPRPHLTNYARDFQTILPCVFDVPVRDVERAAPLHPEDLRRVGRLACPVLRRAACAHLALGQIKNSCALPVLRGFQERAAARLLDVVAMRGYG